MPRFIVANGGPRDAAADGGLERLDRGYPDRLEGEEIPLMARLFAVIDVYDALTSHRPYRAALSHEEAMELIRADVGTHFDPAMAAAFTALMARDRGLRLDARPSMRIFAYAS